MDKPPGNLAVGVAWFEREDYPRILEIMEDASTLYQNYDDWRRVADLAVSQLQLHGIEVARARIKPDEFVAWCRERNVRVNADGRNLWSTEVARRAGKRADG